MSEIPLSPLEARVLTLLANGWTQAEIAEHLNRHPSTIGTAVSRAAQKLGARTATQAVMRAYQTRVKVGGFSIREAMAEEARKRRGGR